MKKISIFFLVVILSTPQVAGAWFQVPSANLSVTIKTIGGDGFFNLNLFKKGGLVFEPIDEFFVQTINGEGSFSRIVDIFGSNELMLKEAPGENWKLKGIQCSSDNPLDQFQPTERGMIFTVQDRSNVHCVFENVPVSFDKNPVLIVPGIMGTQIYKGSELLWPDAVRMLNPSSSDTFMDPLSLRDDATPSDYSLGLGQVIDRVATLNYTERLINEFKALGYTPGTDLFTFPYDWRQDLDKIAKENLTGQIDYILDQTEAGQSAGKVDIIAHSQGGLVVKRLLSEIPDYKNKINKLVFVGVPNLGAPKAAKALMFGDGMGISFLKLGLDPQEVKKITRNMPAVYELLPSREYFSHTSSYMQQSFATGNNSNLDLILDMNWTLTDYSLKESGLNSGLIDMATDFHSSQYDNYDFTGTGIDVYNIVGCQTGTMGKIILKADGTYSVDPVAGDGTVPFFSANNIPGATTFYALESNHGTMLTDDGTRQQIVNIIASTVLPTYGKITTNGSECKFNGIEVKLHSPVELHIYDNQNRHIGPTIDGGFDSEIPNANYEVFGHEKFAFLPEGNAYTVKLIAIDNGNFSLDTSIIQSGQTVNTAHYNSIPVTSSSTAEVYLNEENNQTINFTSDSRVISPTSILNAGESLDIIPPTSTTTLTGTMGKEGFYRSDVVVGLDATDPVVEGHEAETSGILETKYSVDGGAYQVYSSTTPVTVTSEGLHSLKFYSTDRAGNREEEQQVLFTIDKTPPEAILQFSPTLKDLTFTGTDNLSTSSGISVTDSDNLITVKDEAGNTLEIKLKDKGRKKLLRAEVDTLTYNGQATPLAKNALTFIWNYDKKNTLKLLVQNVTQKKGYTISALYTGKDTLLAGKDSSGRILKTLKGLVLLKVTTKLGELGWGY